MLGSLFDPCISRGQFLDQFLGRERSTYTQVNMVCTFLLWLHNSWLDITWMFMAVNNEMSITVITTQQHVMSLCSYILSVTSHESCWIVYLLFIRSYKVAVTFKSIEQNSGRLGTIQFLLFIAITCILHKVFLTLSLWIKPWSETIQIKRFKHYCPMVFFSFSIYSAKLWEN